MIYVYNAIELSNEFLFVCVWISNVIILNALEQPWYNT